MQDLQKTDAQRLYEKNCSLCHGKDGKQMSSGAPDLSLSTLNLEAVLKAIEIGSPQKGMPAYGNRLKQNELISIANYVIELRNK